MFKISSSHPRHPFPFPSLPQSTLSRIVDVKTKKKDGKRYGFLTIDYDEQNVAKKEPVFCRGSLRTRMTNDCKISNCNILILICRCA